MTKTSDQPRRALGKGLGALLPTRLPAPPATVPEASGQSITEVEIDQIDPNPLQPRRSFEPERLRELAQSILSNGIIQPLVVRRQGERFQLIAGERRWRAAKLAGQERVPVVLQDIPDGRLLEITIVENIQREDLNPIETAQAFERLCQEMHLSAEEVGQRTGKDRTTVVNTMRLLQLPADVQQLVADRRLSAGHARCLLGLPSAVLQREVAEKAVARGWSVREVERLTKRMTETRDAKSVEEVQPDPNVKAAIEEMERALGTKVRIVERSNHRGRIEIEYYSPDDLDRIYTVIIGNTTT